MRAWRLRAWLIVYAAAMAYVEAAVVVYLRALYYPQGFAFPLAIWVGRGASGSTHTS